MTASIRPRTREAVSVLLCQMGSRTSSTLARVISVIGKLHDFTSQQVVRAVSEAQTLERLASFQGTAGTVGSLYGTIDTAIHGTACGNQKTKVTTMPQGYLAQLFVCQKRSRQECPSIDMNRLTRDVTRAGAAKEAHHAGNIVGSTASSAKRAMNAVMSGLH